MFTRGGRSLPSMRRALFSRIYSLWPQKKVARRAKNTPLAISRKRALLTLPLWLLSLAWLWIWWFTSGRVELFWLYIPLSAALIYQFAFLPSAFLFFVLRAKNPPNRRLLKDKKVAVITPCVPAQESMEVIERQLRAISEITYPHDSWILDEANSQKIKKMAKKYGVKYFSRAGITKYNRDDYPFKAKTKAGNVNAWLDMVKRRRYDFFVQLDIDHVPKPNYLDKTIGQFRDEKVGWVQSPSVYSNTDNWIARGATEQDFAFHGPVQMGFYGFCGAPMIVGSHCAYRMTAVKEIGGFQPTRAEDHLDTVAMVSRGWKGVFVPEIIAEGNGPETFGAFLTQQFAWAYSMFQVVLKFSPKYLLKTRAKKRLIPLLFCETFYPLWSLSYAITFFMPLIVLTINRNIINMRWSDFLIRILPASMVILLVWFSGRPLTHSKGIRISWRGALLELVRWPILLVAILNALFNVKKPYMVTPKGQLIKDAPPAKVYLPFVFLGLISSFVMAVASFIYDNHATSGQIIFILFNTAAMAAVCLIDINISLRSATKSTHRLSFSWLKPIFVVMSLLIVFSVSIVESPVIEKSIVLALSKPVPITVKLDPSITPVTQLSDQELLQQISTYQKPANTPPPSIGIYDPTRSYPSITPYIRQAFVDWRTPRQVGEEILKSERLGTVPMITIEPAGYKDGHALLQDIANGTFDSKLTKISEILNHVNEPVYIRFAHEMDLSGAFPWSQQDPQLFVTAYRHVIELSRSHNNPDIKWVWSPGGVEGTAEAYYPGDNFVDIIGTTVLYDRYWNGNFHPTFAQLASVRVWLEKYDKPVWIAEFGAGNADADFQAHILSDSVAHFKEYGFSSLIYINIDDPHLKIPNYTLKDQSWVGSILGITAPQPQVIATAPVSVNPTENQTKVTKQETRHAATTPNYREILKNSSLGPRSIQEKNQTTRVKPGVNKTSTTKNETWRVAETPKYQGILTKLSLGPKPVQKNSLLTRKSSQLKHSVVQSPVKIKQSRISSLQLSLDVTPSFTFRSQPPSVNNTGKKIHHNLQLIKRPKMLLELNLGSTPNLTYREVHLHDNYKKPESKSFVKVKVRKELEVSSSAPKQQDELRNLLQNINKL